MLRDCALNVAPACCSHLRLVTLAGPGPGPHLAPDHTEPLSTGHPPPVTGHWPLPREPRAETCSQTQLRDQSAKCSGTRGNKNTYNGHSKTRQGGIRRTACWQDESWSCMSLLRVCGVPWDSFPLSIGYAMIWYRSSFFFLFLEFPHWVVVTWKLFVRNLVLGKLFEAEHLSSELELKVTMQSDKWLSHSSGNWLLLVIENLFWSTTIYLTDCHLNEFWFKVLSAITFEG